MTTWQYTLSEEDLTDAMRRHQLDSMSSWRRTLAICGGYGLFVVAILWFLQGADMTWLTGLVTWAVATVGAYLVARFIMIPFGARLHARRQFRTGPMYAQPIEIEITDAALRLTGSNGETLLRWADIHKLLRDDRVLMLYQSAALFNLLPVAKVPAAMLDEIESRYRASR